MGDNAQPNASPSTSTGSKAPIVSSPAATGGAGTFFEQHVNAYWLVQLLVGAIPPILHDCSVVEVHLQTEVLGWHTDDFLIVGESAPGQQRKLAGQVKRSFTVSATDDECKKAFQDFWADFKDAAHFNTATDRIALVTLRGTNTLLEHFAGLLDAARAARDAAEFEQRLATKGFLNAQSIKYANEIRTIVGTIEVRSVSVGELWPFLRVLHVLSLDLNTATHQTEASMKTLLAHTAGGGDAVGIGWHLWATDRGLALKCVRALAAEAMLVEQAVDAERSRPRKPRAPFQREVSRPALPRRRAVASRGLHARRSAPEGW
jgi:hypothetical protein